MNTLKTQNDISAETKAEIEAMKNSQIDYSDIPEMTEEERKTAQFYNKDFLDNLPREAVKSMIQQRLAAAKAPVTAGK